MTAKEVYENFKDAYFKTTTEKMYFGSNERKAFKSWLSTIPGCFDIEIATWEICKLVGSWLDETEEEIENYFENNSDKTEELFKELITRNFYEMI